MIAGKNPRTVGKIKIGKVLDTFSPFVA